MAGLSACFAIFVVCSSLNFAFGAPNGAKANDLLKLDLQMQSVKAVLTGSNIVEALNEVSNRLEKGRPDPPKTTCPECPETLANVSCPICPKPQCPHVPDNGSNLQNHVNITCPACPAEVTTVSCPEPVTCPACPAEVTTVSCPEPVTCPACPAEVTTVSCPEPVTCPACQLPTMTCTDELTSLPVDCFEYRKRGFVKSGIYKVHPLNYTIDVFCDMETDGGGWTVFQRRGDFGEPKQDFYLNWDDYKNGFGDLNREFWLGNDYLFALTNQKRMSLRVDLEDWEGEKRYAIYEDFLVGPEEDKYRVTFGNYSGNAGNPLNYNNNMFFSTKDRDNDECGCNCAESRNSAWWYNRCTHANLNGLYLRGTYTSDKEEEGVIWFGFKGYFYSLKRSEMKIRPILASE